MSYAVELETDTSIKKDRDTGVQYVDKSIEVFDTDDGQHSSVTKLETSIIPVIKAAFESITKQNNSIEKPPTETKCRLIGKVDPKIVRTWDQLNIVTLRNQTSVDSNSNSTDKQSFTLFCRKRYNFKELEEQLEKFPVKKGQYAESCCDDFFDSIDDKSITEKLLSVSKNLEVIDDNIYRMNCTAGEGMANFDSLEKHKFCWSIDDDA